MTERLTEEQLDKLAYFLNQDREAIALCLDILWIGHYFDDLIDQDRERSPEDAKDAVARIFRRIPLNPFYLRWLPSLQPLLISMAQQYLDSVALEGKDKLLAFVLRNSVLTFIHYCIMLTSRNPDWISEVATDFWTTFGSPLTPKYREFLDEDLRENHSGHRNGQDAVH